MLHFGMGLAAAAMAGAFVLSLVGPSQADAVPVRLNRASGEQ